MQHQLSGAPLAPVAWVGKLRHTGFEISSTAEAGVRPQNLMLASPALGRGLVGSGAWGAHSPFYTLAFLPGDLHPLPAQGPPVATGPWTTDPSTEFPSWTLRSSWRVSHAKEESQAAWCPKCYHAGPGRARGHRTPGPMLPVGCQGTPPHLGPARDHCYPIPPSQGGTGMPSPASSVRCR